MDAVLLPLSQEVYHWPEFKAFAKRLGIAGDLPTTNIVIAMLMNEPVKVYHTYRGYDMQDQSCIDRRASSKAGWDSVDPPVEYARPDPNEFSENDRGSV